MKSVGQQLQDARVARKWTPEMASRETKIKVERLRDLEGDDYANFSSPTYARGFVRTYARALGLDEYKILRQLDHKLPEDDHSTLVHESGTVAYTPVPARPPRPGEGNTAGLFVITGLGLALMAVFAFVIFEAYRAGDLPRYFGSGGEASTAEPTNAPTAANSPPPAALPVDTGSPDVPHAARALPVDPAVAAPSIVAPTDASSTVPNAVRALPVDPADLANGNPGAVPSTPAPVAAPAAPVATPAAPVAGTDDMHAAPRALPVDPAELAAAANAANGPIPGTPVTAAAPAPTPVAVPVNPPTAAPVPVNVPPTATTAPPADATPVLLNDAGLPVHQPALVTPAPMPTAPDASLANKRLVLTAANDSFVRVTAEDAPDVERVLYASVLHAGQSVGFDGHKFSVNVGVPSAVQITLDGVNYGPHSDESSPETFTVESHLP